MSHIFDVFIEQLKKNIKYKMLTGKPHVGPLEVNFHQSIYDRCWTAIRRLTSQVWAELCVWLKSTQSSDNETCIAGRWETYENCLNIKRWKVKQSVYRLVFRAKYILSNPNCLLCIILIITYRHNNVIGNLLILQ